MEDEDRPGFGQRGLQPKEPLAPLTEWRTPSVTPRPASPPAIAAPPRTALLVGGGLALLVAIAGAVLILSEPDVGDLVAATPLPTAAAPKKAPKSAESFVVHSPIVLPSGMQIDRSSILNYDLAAWLATTPTERRSFTFDRLRFEPGSAVLDDSYQPMLQVLSQILTAYPQARVTITGNGAGSLGIERATAIRDALLKLAADPQQFVTAAGDTSETAPSIAVKIEMGVGTDLDA